MFDRQGIYQRFSDCHLARTPVQLAKKLGLRHASVFRWRSGEKPIPWKWLKTLVDDQGVTWDWLLEGKEPKYRNPIEKNTERSFDRHGINQRFLSLFPDHSNAKLGNELGVRDTTVFKWRHDMEQVAWERLKHAVDTKGVTWEWLLEGTGIQRSGCNDVVNNHQ